MPLITYVFSENLVWALHTQQQ